MLTDNDFTYDGTAYRITAIRNRPDTSGLAIEIDQAIPDSLKSALTFHVGNSQFALADASVTGMSAGWSNTGVSWSGGAVQVKLTAPYWTGVDLYGGGLVHSSDGYQDLVITNENGGTNTFLVRLDQAPTANVTVTLQKNFTPCSGCGKTYHGDVNAATVSPTTLTFTTSNWQTGQAVTVTGVPDSDSVHEHLGIWAYVSIASGADTNDPYRNPERVNGIWVTVHDGSDDGSSHGGL